MYGRRWSNWPGTNFIHGFIFKRTCLKGLKDCKIINLKNQKIHFTQTPTVSIRVTFYFLNPSKGLGSGSVSENQEYGSELLKPDPSEGFKIGVFSLKPDPTL